MEPLVGQHLGPYRILEQIGLGGMATVYKAYQPAMERYVAVKLMASHFAQDADFRKRFRREARAVAHLEHAHILPVYDFGEADGQLYLVMRYLEAGSLKDHLAKESPTLSDTNRIISQVGSALDYAHRMGVIHRDVKPANVLLDSEGNAFLTDFGVAKMLGASTHLTATGVGIGTPAYMSPEQGRGEKLDARSDVYALGVMLYEMVTGRLPYEADTPLAVVLKHINAPLPLPRTVQPDLPEGVERVVLRALAKNPKDRFQTVDDMVQALDAAVREAEVAPQAEPAAPKADAKPEGAPIAPSILGKLGALPARWMRVGLWTAVTIFAVAAAVLVFKQVLPGTRTGSGRAEGPSAASPSPPEGAVAEATATVTPVPEATATLAAGETSEHDVYECDPTQARLGLDGPGIDFDGDGSADLTYASHDLEGNAGPYLATEGGSYCGGEVGSGNRIATGSRLDITELCSLETAPPFVPGGTYATYTGGSPGDIFIVRSFDGDDYFKVALTRSSSTEVELVWAPVKDPECQTCTPGEEGMALCDIDWSTPADQARAFAAPILAAIADRPPDFEDDFGDPASGWDVTSEAGNETGYADGEYFALNTSEDAIGTCSTGHSSVLTDLSDFVLDVDGRFVSGQDGRWYIDFRIWEDEDVWNVYEILVDHQGRLLLWRLGPTAHGQTGSGHELIRVEEPIVEAGFETNHIQLIARGAQFALRVNGRWAGFAADPGYTERLGSGEMALKVCRTGDEPLRAHWDNLKIWDISDLPLPAASDTPRTGAAGAFVDSGQRLGSLRSLSVALGDLDGDADPDAFVANGHGDDDTTPNKIWLNDGTGQFEDSGQDLGASSSEDVALGDLDGDGDLDAFVVTDRANKVWLNDGTGRLADSGQNLGAMTSMALALGDLDGDGDLDAFVGNGSDDSGPQSNAIWLNDGASTFTDSGQSLSDSFTAAVALGDLDGDGDLDAFVANGEGGSDVPDPGEANEVWLNDGTGTFTDSVQRLGNSLSHAVDLGDLDGDGDLDAYVGNAAIHADKVWLNDGSGQFSDSGQSLFNHTAAVALEDLDGDGDLDVFVGTYDSFDGVWLNDGAGRFTDSGLSLSVVSQSRGLALGDLDGDGDLDAFVGAFGWPEGQPNTVWLNQTFAPGSSSEPLPSGAFVIDGAAYDWADTSTALNDPLGDFVQASEYGTDDDPAGDIKALHVGSDADYVYLMATFYRPESREHLVYDVILFGNAQTSYHGYQIRFNREHRGSLEAWLDKRDDELLEIEPDPDIKAAIGTVFEMRIPWRTLEGQFSTLQLDTRTRLEDPDEGIILPYIDNIRFYHPAQQAIAESGSPTPVRTEGENPVTLVIQPGPDGGIDAQLPERVSYNYGKWDQLEVGSDENDRALHHSLIKFDLVDQLPAGAVIESATLELHAAYLTHQGIEVWVHEVLVPWDEGTGIDDGGPSTYDGTTWSHRRYGIPGDAGSGIAWHKAGCSGRGTDFEAQAEDSASVTDGWNRWELSPELVQRWLEDPETNHGLVITDHDAERGKVHFPSSDHPDQRLWPRLVIQYQTANP